MGYFSNPNFYYLQPGPPGYYTQKKIDDAIVYAYKNGKKKVVNENTKYDVKKEIERIKKYRTIRLSTKSKSLKKTKNEGKRKKKSSKRRRKKF